MYIPGWVLFILFMWFAPKELKNLLGVLGILFFVGYGLLIGVFALIQYAPWEGHELSFITIPLIVWYFVGKSKREEILAARKTT